MSLWDVVAEFLCLLQLHMFLSHLHVAARLCQLVLPVPVWLVMVAICAHMHAPKWSHLCTEICTLCSAG